MPRLAISLQIYLTSIVTLIIVLFAMWYSIISVQNNMNNEERQKSIRTVEGRLQALQSEVSIIASDYHNWTDLYINAMSHDIPKLASNFGVTAHRGDIFHYAAMFGGPFSEDLSWAVGESLEPRRHSISLATKSKVSQEVSKLATADRETFDYYAWNNTDLYMYSSSFLLPEDKILLRSASLDLAPIAIIGKIFSHEMIANLSTDLGLTELELVRETVASEKLFVPLSGMGGIPIAFIEWHPPEPGSVLLRKVEPILAALSIALVTIIFGAAILLKRRTDLLIVQDALSAERSRTDVLTGLHNRVALIDDLEANFHRGTSNFAVIAIDLDRFKLVNDSLGHSGGDSFLQVFADRLKTINDPQTKVYRYGGDEFLIVIEAESELRVICEGKVSDLKDLCSEPIPCVGSIFPAAASKGIFITDGSPIDQYELLRRADYAMYISKNHRDSEVVEYDTSMMQDNEREREIELLLRTALASRSEFSIHYQPIVSSNHPFRVVRYEALARWTSEKLGSINPQVFIGIAERSGLIVSLGWLLLDLVLEDLVQDPVPSVSINVSPTQLVFPGFRNAFLDRVRKSGINPSRIEIEVTEEVAVFDDDRIYRTLVDLGEDGFSLALDDFGTGYSSVRYLTKMPFDVLKIDRSFIPSRSGNHKNNKMLSSMIGIGKALDLQIVAEGIESQEDVAALQEIGIDFFQGYHFGRPQAYGLRVGSSALSDRVAECIQ